MTMMTFHTLFILLVALVATLTAVQFEIAALDLVPVNVVEDESEGGVIETVKVEEESLRSKMLPVVVNTWPFVNATRKAWSVLSDKGTALDAVERGCRVCQDEQCDGTVGYGGSPDENGETTLDAMIMDGVTMSVGAVASMKRIKDAVGVARKVMEHTQHTMLVGESATRFAISMGFPEEDLTTGHSSQLWTDWKTGGCQPNFWKNVSPDPQSSCGPYTPDPAAHEPVSQPPPSSDKGHDTIGMIAIDSSGRIASATSTNGARFKIPGRVGDSAITGSGSYADQSIGGAAATGDGDVLVRFLPSLVAVEYMRLGMTPSKAAEYSLRRIARYFPNFKGAVVTLTVQGQFGAACHGFDSFSFSAANGDLAGANYFPVTCSQPGDPEID